MGESAKGGDSLLAHKAGTQSLRAQADVERLW